jgi:hypothetical protein
MVAMISSHASRWSGGGDAPLPERGEQAGDDAGPVVAEEDHQGDSGGDVHGDDEGQVWRIRRSHVQVVRPGPAEQAGDEDAVAKAGDGE